MLNIMNVSIQRSDSIYIGCIYKIFLGQSETFSNVALDINELP